MSLYSKGMETVEKGKKMLEKREKIKFIYHNPGGSGGGLGRLWYYFSFPGF